MSKHLRPSAWLARIGGDEFLVAMTDCSRSEMTERMQRVLDRQSLEVQEGARASLPFSFGIAAVNPEDDLDAVLARADAALYRQKEQRH